MLPTYNNLLWNKIANWHLTEPEGDSQNPQPDIRAWNDGDGIFHVDCGLHTQVTFNVALQLVKAIVELASRTINEESGLNRKHLLLIHAPFVIEVDEAARDLLFNQTHGGLTSACAILMHPKGHNEYVGALFVFLTIHLISLKYSPRRRRPSRG